MKHSIYSSCLLVLASVLVAQPIQAQSLLNPVEEFLPETFEIPSEFRREELFPSILEIPSEFRREELFPSILEIPLELPPAPEILMQWEKEEIHELPPSRIDNIPTLPPSIFNTPSLPAPSEFHLRLSP